MARDDGWSLAIAAALLAEAGRKQFIGIDLASGPDRIAYWPLSKPSPNGPTIKRAKVKAARKQNRNRKKGNN